MRACNSLLTLLLTVLFALAAPCGHAAAAGGTPAPARDPDTASAAAAGPDKAAVDTALRAAEPVWNAYRHSVFEGLGSSPDPHDWALAAIAARADVSPGDTQRRTGLLTRAVAALPDDVLVNWIALRMKAGPDTLPALERLEPDNAAVWAEALTRAAMRKDAAAVGAALDRMAAGTRFDDHAIDLIQHFAAAYRRYPVPPEYLALAAKTEPGITDESMDYAAAIAETMAVALPAYEHLFRACRIDPATGVNAQRASDCAAVGRLLASRGPDMIANRIGYALLRISHTFTDEDVRRARDLDWVWQQLSAIALPQETPAHMIQRIHDRDESGSELESMRRALVRAGQATTPPADWIDPQSPFSAQRLQDDERNAVHRAAHPF